MNKLQNKCAYNLFMQDCFVLMNNAYNYGDCFALMNNAFNYVIFSNRLLAETFLLIKNLRYVINVSFQYINKSDTIYNIKLFQISIQCKICQIHYAIKDLSDAVYNI